MTNFAKQLSLAASDASHRPAIKLDEQVLSYADLDAAAALAAGLLRAKGVGVGDRVGMQLPNVSYFPIVYFGVLRLGAVVVPMNPLLKERVRCLEPQPRSTREPPHAGALCRSHGFRCARFAWSRLIERGLCC